MFSTWRYQPGSRGGVSHQTFGLAATTRSAPQQQACNSCRAKKIRCSGEKEGCERCKTLDTICHYAKPSKENGNKSRKRNKTRPTSSRNENTSAMENQKRSTQEKASTLSSSKAKSSKSSNTTSTSNGSLDGTLLDNLSDQGSTNTLHLDKTHVEEKEQVNANANADHGSLTATSAGVLAWPMLSNLGPEQNKAGSVVRPHMLNKANITTGKPPLAMHEEEIVGAVADREGDSLAPSAIASPGWADLMEIPDDSDHYPSGTTNDGSEDSYMLTNWESTEKLLLLDGDVHVRPESSVTQESPSTSMQSVLQQDLAESRHTTEEEESMDMGMHMDLDLDLNLHLDLGLNPPSAQIKGPRNDRGGGSCNGGTGAGHWDMEQVMTNNIETTKRVDEQLVVSDEEDDEEEEDDESENQDDEDDCSNGRLDPRWRLGQRERQGLVHPWFFQPQAAVTLEGNSCRCLARVVLLLDEVELLSGDFSSTAMAKTALNKHEPLSKNVSSRHSNISRAYSRRGSTRDIHGGGGSGRLDLALSTIKETLRHVSTTLECESCPSKREMAMLLALLTARLACLLSLIANAFQATTTTTTRALTTEAGKSKGSSSHCNSHAGRRRSRHMSYGTGSLSSCTSPGYSPSTAGSSNGGGVGDGSSDASDGISLFAGGGGDGSGGRSTPLSSVPARQLFLGDYEMDCGIEQDVVFRSLALLMAERIGMVATTIAHLPASKNYEPIGRRIASVEQSLDAVQNRLQPGQGKGHRQRQRQGKREKERTSSKSLWFY